MSSYDMETTIQLPEEEDVDVHIDFEVENWGSPGSAPSLSYPGDPPEGPEFYVTKVSRLDNDTDITDQFEALDDKARQKVEELVFERICEIEQSRDDYDY